MTATGKPAGPRTGMEAQRKPWEEVRDDLIAQLHAGQDGVLLAESLAARADALITQVARQVLSADQWKGLALIAVGGYGQRMLAPGSDVDLILLHRWYQRHGARHIARLLVPALWDMGLRPGFAIRMVHECGRLAKADLTCLTTLRSARLLIGDRGLADSLSRSLDALPRTRAGKYLLRTMIQEVLARRSHDDQQSEPDLKNGPGGIRDLQFIDWIAWLATGRRFAEHLPCVWKTASDEERLRSAQELLWRVRWWLHALAPRCGDRLALGLQDQIAQRLGYRDSEDRHAAEQLLVQLNRTRRLVVSVLDRLIAHFDASPSKSRPSASPVPIRQVGGRLWDIDGHEPVARDPELAIQLLDALAQMGGRPGAVLLNALERLCSDRKIDWTAARRMFLARLGRSRGLGAFVRLLNETGLLARLLPGWERIHALPQLTSYHAYTVDEHCIAALEMACTAEAAERDELWNELSRPLSERDRSILHLALLLHDAGKGSRSDHSRVGARIARSVAEQLMLTNRECELLVFLVASHLSLSGTAFHRDPHDLASVRELAETVQTPHRLKLLYLLTICDILAAGPGRLTSWKLDLLRLTYQSTHAILTGSLPPALLGHTSHLPEKKRELAAQYGATSGTRFQSWLAMLPPEYLHAYPPERVVEDYREISRLRRSKCRVRVEAATGSRRRVRIYSHDRPRLFLDIVAGLYAAGTDVLHARATTLPDGSVIDEFLVVDHVEDSPELRHRRIEQAILEATVSQNPRELLKHRPLVRRSTSLSPLTQPRVAFENQEDVTLVEVFAPDYPGLLYDVLLCLYTHRLDITKACVATYGDRAVDVFYVRDQFGHPVTDEAHLKRLRHDLVSTLQKLVPARHV